MASPSDLKLALGQQVNLVHGIRPNVNNPFWDLQRAGARLLDSAISDPSTNPPSGPVKLEASLVFCDSWSDLLVEYFSTYHIPACCCSNELRNAAPLFMQPGQQAAVHKQVADALGIPAEFARDSAFTGFAFVRVTKPIGNSNKWDADLGSVATVSNMLNVLPAQADPSQPVPAAPYLDAFQTVGTHYVSEVQMGEVAMQAFVYQKDVLDVIREDENFQQDRISDPATIGLFRNYTAQQKLGNGFTITKTKVATASGSAAFESQVVPKLADYTAGLQASIFTLIKEKTVQDLFKPLTDSVPIKVVLNTITDLLPVRPPGQPSVASPFCSLLDAALLQKFGRAATHDTVREALLGKQPDYATMYKTTLPELVTTAATSVVAISQMYFRLDNIHKEKLLYAKDTREVQVFGDVIEVKRSLELPGDKITLISRLLLASPTDDGKAPVVTVGSKDAFDSFGTVIEKVLGTMALEGPAGSGLRRTFHNSVALQTAKTPATPGGPIDVVLEKVISNTYMGTDQLGNYNVQLGIQTTLLVAENALNYRFNPGLTDAAMEYAGWLKRSLGKVIPDDAATAALPLPADARQELNQALGRVALLLSAPSDGRDTIIVPRSTYKEYSAAIERMTDATQAYADALGQAAIKININKAQEATSEQVGALNKNVQAIGQFLLKQNEVSTEKENDMAAANQTLIDKLQADLLSAQKKFSNGTDGLKEKMLAQMKNLDSAKERMQEGIKRANDRAKTEMALNVVGAIVSVAGACAGLSAAGGLGALNSINAITTLLQNAAKMEKVFKVLEALMKLGSTSVGFESLRVKFSYADGRNAAVPPIKFADLENATNQVPSDLDWNNFDAEVAAQVAAVAAMAPEANDFVVEAKKMSNIGRAISSNLSTQSSLLYSILVQTTQQDVAKKQATRLQWLQTQLNQPDLPKQKASEINLFELGTLMEARANRTTLTLLRTLALQDAALQYAYFQEPAKIEKAASLNVLDVHDLLVSQANNTINALSNLEAPSNLPDPISYVMSSVPVAALQSDAGYQFVIDTGNKSIPSFYSRVRINFIEVEFTKNQPKTNSGIVVTVLSPSAQFADRAPDGTTHLYRAITPASYNYAYNLSTKATTFSNIPTDEFKSKFMQMTPFTKWTLQLPNNQQNAALSFLPGEPSTEVTIRFYCNAIYNAKPQAAPRMLSLDPRTAGGNMRGMPVMSAARAMRKRALDASGAWTNLFDTTVKYDNWVDPASHKTFNVRVELGPMVPSYEFSPDKTRMKISCMLAVARLEPVVDTENADGAAADGYAAAAAPLVLPPGYFKFEGSFTATTDGDSGYGFLYNNPGTDQTQISVVQDNDKWKQLKDPIKKKLRYPDPDAIEANRALLEQAIANYFIKVRSDVKVRALSKPEDTEHLMINKSIMKGWDVVCAFDSDQISSLLEEKWKQEYAAWQANPVVHDGHDLGTVFKISTPKTLLATVPDPEDDEKDMELYIEMEAVLGPARISFVSNQPGECSFRMLILQGKTITSNSKYPEKRKEKSLDVGAAAISGIVSLSVLTGVVDTSSPDGTYGVYIELEKAAFKAIADVPDMQLSSLSLALKTYFTEQMPNKKIFLGAAKMADFCKFDALLPRHFYMTTVRPDLAGPGVLLMFITTNGTDGKDRSLDVLHNPLKDGYSAAIYVNSRILYKDILLPQVKSALAPGTRLNQPGDWCEAVQDPINFCYSIRAKPGLHMWATHIYIRSGFSDQETDVWVPLDAFKVAPGDVNKITTTFANMSFDQNVPWCSAFACGTVPLTMHLDHVGFTDLVPQIANTDQQTISLGTWRRDDSPVAVSDNYDPSGWQKFLDAFNNRNDIRDHIKASISNMFRVTDVKVPDFSLFAVSNLLFPGSNIMKVEEAYCPGDLLILGHVNKTLYPDGTSTTTEPATTRSLRRSLVSSLGLPSAWDAAASLLLKRRALDAAAAHPAKPLLSELSGRSAIDPWTIAVAISTDHINQALASAPTTGFPSVLAPAPSVIGGDDTGVPEVQVELKITGLGNPTLQLINAEASRVQLKVPITTATVVQATIIDGDMMPSRPMKLNSGSLTVAARLVETTTQGSYTLAADLASADVTALDLASDKVSALVIADLKGKLATEVQNNGGKVPIAVLNLPAVDDLGHLDTFTYAVVARGAADGSGAVVMAAGESAAVSSKSISLSSMKSLPVVPGARACVYLNNKILTESILLPGIRQAGATASAVSLFKDSIVVPSSGTGALANIAGGSNKLYVDQVKKAPADLEADQVVAVEDAGAITVYKVSDHPADDKIGFDIIVPLSGMKFGVNGQAVVPGDTLTVSWNASWNQSVAYTIGDRLPWTLDLTYSLSMDMASGTEPVQLVRSSMPGAPPTLEFPPIKLGAAHVSYTKSHKDVLEPPASTWKKEAEHIQNVVAVVLQGVHVPGFSATGPALGAAEYVLANLGPAPAGTVAPEPLRSAQAYMPGDLVLVAS